MEQMAERKGVTRMTDLRSLTQLGRVEKEIEIGSFKVKLHTLTVADQQKALLSISEEIKDDTARLFQMQKAILVYATDSINGEVVEKDKLHELYNELQPVVLSNLFSGYLELVDEQSKILDELKKK